MTLYLVRHAKAVSRSSWPERDQLRPLTPGGHRQALRLVEELGSVSRIVSSPFLRCRQTVEPMAGLRGLPLEIDDRLAEGSQIEPALDLLEELAQGDALVCAHGDLIPAFVEELGRAGLRRKDPIPCEKGSVWVLDRAPSPSTRYIPPPTRSSRAAPPEAARRRGNDARVAAEDVDAAEDRKLRVAVLDLGSTSFHLLVADASPVGDIQRVVRERTMLRLGAVIAAGRRVPEESCQRAVEAARQLREVAAEAKADVLLPVATAALREAENGGELAARIAEAVGEPVRILSGEQEARLMFAAFRHRVPMPDAGTLGIDLGGGSLELAIGDPFQIHWETTLRLGVARLHGELAPSDPMPARQRRAVCDRVRELLAPHRAEVARRAPAGCVATGGTVAALARRIATRRTSWPRRSVSQLFVPRSELREVAEELLSSSHDERLRQPGIARQRVDLLPTGALVLETLAEELGLDGFTVSDWGLREGIILEALGLARAERHPPE